MKVYRTVIVPAKYDTAIVGMLIYVFGLVMGMAVMYAWIFP